jgi:hypothetical protein
MYILQKQMFTDFWTTLYVLLLAVLRTMFVIGSSICSWNSGSYTLKLPVTVDERSKVWTSSIAWRTWQWVWIPLRAWTFFVYMCLFCLCAVLCLGRGLSTSWSLVQGVLPIVNRSGNWKEARVHKGCRAIQNTLKLLTYVFFQILTTTDQIPVLFFAVLSLEFKDHL